MFTLTRGSLYVADLDLWLDASSRRTRCYVSHGHSDHARRHDVVLATPESGAICRSRLGAGLVVEEHPYGEPFNIGEAHMVLFPAGHILGSSQLLIETEGGRCVYTGDFKLGASRTCAPAEVRQCDVLLMECTFGSSRYVFPPREEVCAALVAWARGTLEAGATPVVFAYSLGKSQEAMAILGAAGIPLMVHEAAARLAEVYRACGVLLPPYLPLEPAASRGYAVVLPPGGAAAGRALAALHKPRTAMVSGWAIDGGTRGRYGVDAAFPLSDHADFDELLRYVELAAPRKVLLFHGCAGFARDLRRRGVDAEFLEERTQMSLL